MFIIYPNIDIFFDECTLRNNSALTGGAIAFSNSGYFSNNTGNNTFIDSTIIDNSSELISFMNTLLIGNSAYTGGALYFDNPSNLTPKFGNSCLIQENRADAYGGGIWFGRYNTPVCKLLYLK